MATKTYQEQLEEVQTAISAVLTGSQSYTVEGHSLTRGDLTTLMAEEKRLRIMANREANGGGISVYGATPVDS